MSQILDQFGYPMKKSELLSEQATPQITGVRNLVSTRQTIGLDPAKLARIMRDADEGDMTAYLELAEELEEKDTHYIAVLGTRKRAVAQLEISVEPASEDKADIENAKLIQDFLDRDQLQAEIMDMLDAIGKGFSVLEIIWDVAGNVWLPKDLKWHDPRWFEFSKEDGETLRLRDGTGSVELLPNKFIVHRHKAKSGLTARGGVVRPCAWMWLFKNFSIKDWVVFAEAYGQPVRIGKYNPSASKDDKNILMRAVASIGSDAAAIIPESMKIEFVEAAGKTATADVFERLLNVCDQQISKAVLGQTTTTDAISGGHAVSKEHNEVREDIEKADAMQLASTLNTQLVIPIIIFNRGVQQRYPRIRIGRPEQVDAVQFSQVVSSGVKLGLQISASKTREMLGLPAPADEADTIRVTMAPELDDQDAEEKPPAKETAAERPQPSKDAIDELVDEMAADYEEIINPMISLLQAAANRSGDFESFKQELLLIAGNNDAMGKMADVMARASFNARLAGNLEIPLDPDNG